MLALDPKVACAIDWRQSSLNNSWDVNLAPKIIILGSCFEFWVRSRAAPVAKLVAHSALSGRVTPEKSFDQSIFGHTFRISYCIWNIISHKLTNLAVSDHRYLF
ncbi:hypothetical protein PROFUN_15331 [Planoprotostelium fungivorum]|uniref:Uncharacterized protein n=1 Tax=Planoprotostelium fungivorum TaxID=1890364 RepID=A0A2P6MWY6_9EUKA|nr:hypothetical protein PROFUN_15331 [Planoprotostelium fungivorum]